jgi:tRNA-(ms[2]io[6]A)-hydroxylase
MHQYASRISATQIQGKISISTGTEITAMIELKFKTPLAWAEGIVNAMDVFLPDHAAAEKKASSMAMTMVSHYPDRPELVSAMIDLALEELSHFRSVVKLMQDRGLVLLPDEKDPYVNALRREARQGSDLYLMDRLLIAGIVESRGAERFGLIAAALPEGEMKRFYDAVTRSEQGHEELFLQFARRYFDSGEVQQRLDELLTAEAAIVRNLPIRLALH